MQYINMICYLYIAQNIDIVLCISSQMLNIYIVLCNISMSNVAIEDNILNNGEISPTDVEVSEKLFLPFPDMNDVMS